MRFIRWNSYPNHRMISSLQLSGLLDAASTIRQYKRKQTATIVLATQNYFAWNDSIQFINNMPTIHQ